MEAEKTILDKNFVYLLHDIKNYLMCASQGSMSRNNSEQLASELFDSLELYMKSMTQSDDVRWPKV